jgi:hypothetical protein
MIFPKTGFHFSGSCSERDRFGSIVLQLCG